MNASSIAECAFEISVMPRSFAKAAGEGSHPSSVAGTADVVAASLSRLPRSITRTTFLKPSSVAEIAFESSVMPRSFAKATDESARS